MTETGLSLGTPHYMSPEQATAEKDISARSDVYSLGSVLYEMLTGNPPHTGASAQQIIMKIITAPADLVTVHRKSVPPNVAAAVAKSLEKLPADRFESAKAFSEALGNPAYTNATVLGAVPSPALARRHRATTTAGFVLAALAFAGWAWSASRPQPAGSGEPRFYSITLPDSAPVVSGRDQYDVTLRSFDLSADGRLLVYTSPHDSATRLWQLRTDLGTASPIAGTAGAVLPTLSPDGHGLAFAVDNEVRRLTLADGAISRAVASQSREAYPSSHPWTGGLDGSELWCLALLHDAEWPARYAERRHFLPRADQPRGSGQAQFAFFLVLADVARGDLAAAAALYPVLRQILDDGWRVGPLQPVEGLVGLAATAGGHWDVAEGHFRSALAFVDQIGDRLGKPSDQKWYAWMLLRRNAPGDREQARVLLDEAIASFRAIGMALSLGHAEAMREPLNG